MTTIVEKHRIRATVGRHVKPISNPAAPPIDEYTMIATKLSPWKILWLVKVVLTRAADVKYEGVGIEQLPQTDDLGARSKHFAQ